jgi:palmitoyl transferase
MTHRRSGFGLADAFLGVVMLVVPHVVLGQDAGPPPPPPSVQQGGSTEGATSGPPAESSGPDQTNRGFWASFAHSTPLGLSPRAPGEAGFWSRTGEGMKRLWSEGKPTLIVSGYAWHLPWKHKTERQKAFNDAAWGAGFGRTYAENDRRQRIFYAIANNDSHDKMQYMTGYAWQARWHPYGTLRLGAGYTMFLIGRHEYNYAPIPLMLPAFTVGTDAADLFATYVPYGEVILLVGRFTF